MSDNEKTAKTEKSKRKLIKLTIISSFIIILAIMTYKYDIKQTDGIQEINENIDKPFDFGVPMEKYNINSKDCVKDKYYGVEYTNQEGDGIRFYGFPDISDTYKVTGYSTSNKKKSVFGFHVGDNMNKVDRILKEHDYYLDEKSDDRAVYMKGKVYIAIYIQSDETETGTINETVAFFKISLQSTDKFHKVKYK